MFGGQFFKGVIAGAVSPGGQVLNFGAAFKNAQRNFQIALRLFRGGVDDLPFQGTITLRQLGACRFNNSAAQCALVGLRNPISDDRSHG